MEADPLQWNKGSPPLEDGEKSAPDISDRPLTEVRARSATTPLSEQKDRLFLALGAVYEMVGVASDLLEQFSYDERLTFDIKSYIFDRPVISGLRDWSNIVQSVPIEITDRLYTWLGRQAFRDLRRGYLWRLTGEVIRVVDPVLLDRGGIVSPDKLVPVTVVLPGAESVDDPGQLRGQTKVIESGLSGPARYFWENRRAD
jgi:hypothetical protein